MDVSDIFSFFLLEEGEGESRGDREGRGVGFLLKIPGVYRGGGRGAGRMSAGNWGGGGLNIFFRGRNGRQVT